MLKNHISYSMEKLPGSLFSFIFSASKGILAQLISLLSMDCVTFFFLINFILFLNLT